MPQSQMLSLTHIHAHTRRQLLPLWPLECCAVLQIELNSDFNMTFESCTHATWDQPPGLVSIKCFFFVCLFVFLNAGKDKSKGEKNNMFRVFVRKA